MLALSSLGSLNAGPGKECWPEYGLGEGSVVCGECCSLAREKEGVF